MKTLVPSLAAVALVGLATSSLSAASIKDEAAGLSLSIKGQIQVRLTLMPEAVGSDVTSGMYPAGPGTNPYSWQGGDPVRYAAAPTSTTGAASTTGISPFTNPTQYAAAQYTKDGEAYDIHRGQFGESEQARFDVKRARLFFDATYGDGWIGSIVLTTDGTEANGSNANRGVNLRKATAGKQFEMGGIKHEITAGLDAPYSLDTASGSTSYAFPYRNPAAGMVDLYRGGGLFYMAKGSLFNVGASFMNNTNTTTTPPGGSSNGILSEGDKGNVATLRAEFSPSKDMKPSSYRESYVGAEGTHLLIGYDIESEWGRQISYTAPQNYNITTYPGALAAYNPASPYYGPWYDQDTIVHGPDAVFHHKALTATVAYKYRITSWSTNTDAAGAPVDPDDTHSDAFAISLAYAIPVSDMAIEPAFRYSYLNADRKRDEYSNYGRGFDYNSFATPATASPWASNRNDTTGSGDQFELGVNMYWNTKVGHSNKTQLAYVNWQAEEGVGRASAVVVQHQLLF